MSAMRITTAALGALCFVAACGGDTTPFDPPSQFHIVITSVNGKPLPEAGQPLPANRGDVKERWGFTIEARTPGGEPDPSFDGVVRLSTKPGAISKVMGEGAIGRNIRLTAGKALGEIELTAVYGSSRLWVEDLGYVPAKPGKKPLCSNGKDDDGDILIDFPADPGCAYADDDTEEGGTYAAGVSQAVNYALPKISDIQGNGPPPPIPTRGWRSTPLLRKTSSSRAWPATASTSPTSTRTSRRTATTTSSPSTSRRRRACASATASPSSRAP